MNDLHRRDDEALDAFLRDAEPALPEPSPVFLERLHARLIGRVRRRRRVSIVAMAAAFLVAAFLLLAHSGSEPADDGTSRSFDAELAILRGRLDRLEARVLAARLTVLENVARARSQGPPVPTNVEASVRVKLEPALQRHLDVAQAFGFPRDEALDMVRVAILERQPRLETLAPTVDERWRALRDRHASASWWRDIQTNRTPR